jgi:hypothetical protein
LITFEDALELEGALLPGSFFNAQGLPLLPFAIDQGGGNLVLPDHDGRGCALLLRFDGAKVNSAVVSGDEKLIAPELGYLRAERPLVTERERINF